MNRVLRSVLTALFALAASVLYAQSILDPEPLANFDGHEWSGLELGKMTDADIKRRFRTERGAVRPEALKFVMDKGGTVRVDALLDGRGAKAVMRAIRVEFLARDPKLMDLVDAWDERPEMYFQKGRTEDWHLEVFENRGMIAVVVGPDMHSNISSVILTSPERIGLVTRQFSDRQTPIEPPRDPGEGWNRQVGFDWATANVSLGSLRPDFMDFRWVSNLETSLRDEALTYRGRNLRARSGKGSLAIRARTETFRSDATRWTIALDLAAQTPYGELRLSSDDSRDIVSGSRGRIFDLLNSVLDDLDAQVAREIRGFGPEPKEAARLRAVDMIYRLASGS